MQVLVLRMQTKGSVEQRILEASSQKKSLADRSITGKKLLQLFVLLYPAILALRQLLAVISCTSCDQLMCTKAFTLLG